MSDNLSSGRIAAAIGAVVAAAAVSSIGLYLYFREESDEALLRQHLNSKSSTSFCLRDRIRVPRDIIGNVIGRGGENVKRIQSETKTRIHFDEERDGSGDKWATICGTESGIELAKEQIRKIMTDKSVDVLVEEIPVPYHLIGQVIGRGGCTINAMTESSGAKINVPRTTSAPVSGYVTVLLKGTMNQINEARRQITEIIAHGVTTRHDDSRKPFNKIANGFRNPVPVPVSPTSKLMSPLSDLTPVSGSPPEPAVTVTDSYRPEVWEEPLTEELVPTQEDMLQVYVSHVDSPSRFWVQIFGPKSTALDKLSNEMTDYYEVNSRKDKVTSLQVGDIVAGQYTATDPTWYRVRVVGIEERTPIADSDVRVYYLDFGGHAVQKRRSLCTLKHEFLIALPFQAVQCCLNGVLQLPDNDDEDENPVAEETTGQTQSTATWSIEAASFFADAVHSSDWIEILARPYDKLPLDPETNTGPVVPVDLYDFKDKPSGMISISDLMVSKGFAQKITPNGTTEESDVRRLT